MAPESRARNAGTEAKQAANKAADAAESPWVQTLGKVGVAAIGIVHILLGWLALQVAFGGGSGTSNDNTGALRQLAGNGPGKVLLGLMAVGLAAYVVWQVTSASIGFRAEQDEKKRTVKRVKAVFKAVLAGSLCLQSVRLLTQGSSQSSSDKQQDWTASLLQAPAGKVLVVLIGLAVIGYAGYQAYTGYQAKFAKKIDGGVSPAMKRFGQFGYIARGVVFGVLGILVVIAGVTSDSEKSGGLDAALKTLRDQPFGKWLLALVALGLAAYGVFTVITAPRRREA